jgi:serine/threonine-protein kinase CHEK1
MTSSQGKERKYYVYDGVIGSGSYGDVYKGYYVFRDHERVNAAVKQFNARAMSPETRSKFHMPEAYQMAKVIDSPHVMRVMDVGQQGGKTYAVTEWLPGEEVYELWNKKRLGNEQYRIKILQAITSGIADIHSYGIAHMDIKLENMVTVKGNDILRVIDDDFMTKETWRYIPCGTPTAMAPEVMVASPGIRRKDGKGYDGRIGYDPMLADIWSTAVVILEIASGNGLWEWATDDLPTRISRQKHFEERKELIWESIPVSREIAELTADMLTWDPRKRISSNAVARRMSKIKRIHTSRRMRRDGSPFAVKRTVNANARGVVCMNPHNSPTNGTMNGTAMA